MEHGTGWLSEVPVEELRCHQEKFSWFVPVFLCGRGCHFFLANCAWHYSGFVSSGQLSRQGRLNPIRALGMERVMGPWTPTFCPVFEDVNPCVLLHFLSFHMGIITIIIINVVFLTCNRGYVITFVQFVCLFVCLLAALRKNQQMYFHENLWWIGTRPRKVPSNFGEDLVPPPNVSINNSLNI